MTREEAIAIIENEKECVNRANKNDYCNRDCYNCELVKTDTEILTALDIAIKALEQEPCEDAISRKDLLSKAWFVTGDDFPMEDLEYITKGMVKDMPPVIPKQKTGRWISGHKETGALGIVYTEKICSNCGWNHSLVIPRNYCPNCGAKMVEPQESEGEE